MCVTLLEVFGYKFHAYPTMLAIAFLFGTLLAVREGARLRPPIYATPQAGLWIFFSALVGAKVFWILQYSDWRHLTHSFNIWEGGLVFYGGMVGGALGCAACFYFYRYPVIRSFDVAVIYLAFGQGVTRIGCFLNGCCWGKPGDVPWAVHFPHGSHPFKHQVEMGLIERSADASLPVHPTQLYMVLGLALTFGALKLYSRYKPFHGAVVLLYCVLYGALRFTVEIFRDRAQGGDSVRSVLDRFTVSQTISGLLLIGGAALLIALSTGMLRIPRWAALGSETPPLAADETPSEDDDESDAEEGDDPEEQDESAEPEEDSGEAQED